MSRILKTEKKNPSPFTTASDHSFSFKTVTQLKAFQERQFHWCALMGTGDEMDTFYPIFLRK